MASLYVVTVFDPVETSEPMSLVNAQDEVTEYLIQFEKGEATNIQSLEDQDGSVEWVKYWQGDVLLAQVHRVDMPDEG